MAAPSKKSAGKTAAKHTRRTKAVDTKKTAPRHGTKPAAKSRPAKKKSAPAAVPPIVPAEQRTIADTTRRMVAAESSRTSNSFLQAMT